ncbi:hypothetical protein PT974_06722 [Cladobotryum mycophilum]|uniref:N-acetyltransferase domain-containing protein n=1 Tax=Cladobotryum mycophilum TaxID=491253 RepID=A0ABR0SMF9_9HYPO
MSNEIYWGTDTSSEFQDSGRNTTALWDYQNCIPIHRIPAEEKPVVLITPVIAPPIDRDPNDNRDPFEILGQALSARDIPIRHVPYTISQGVNGIHVAFIRRARAVIFIITGFPESEDEGPSQPKLAELVARICESQPLIIIACCDVTTRKLPAARLQTVVQTTGCSRADLQATATLLVDGDSALIDPRPSLAYNTPPDWSVQPWNVERDLVETYELWRACLPRKFHLNISVLESLLRRDGYALHFTVREPSRGTLVGFCATYTTFADNSGEELVGSVATLIVRAAFRNQGVGLILHDAATTHLQRIRGVGRLQLGTTYPRLLYGMPVEAPIEPWFEKRGWLMDGPGPGKGRLISDWILRFSDLPGIQLASAGLDFKRCDESNAHLVLDIVKSHQSVRNPCFGWYDQYARTMNSGHMGSIIVGYEGTIIVTTAIIFCPADGGPAASDVPWPGEIGHDIGGVTCICIRDDNPEMVSRRDTVVIRLLHACVRMLSEKGMSGMFLDGVRFGEYRLGTFGFRRWADYRDVWLQL